MNNHVEKNGNVHYPLFAHLKKYYLWQVGALLHTTA